MKNLMKSSIAILMSVLTVFALFVPSFAAEKTYKKGDIIEFGSYPQSQVTDAALIAELSKIKAEWNEMDCYGYDEEEHYVYGKFRQYYDFEYKNNKYRAIKNKGDAETSWFRFDPIEWVVIEPETGYVLCNDVLDKQVYNINGGYSDSAEWETSSIRVWLNDVFYKDAFSEDDKENITVTKTEIKNYIDENKIITSDKVTLFSLEDVLNEKYDFYIGYDYGFEDKYVCTTELCRYATEYGEFLGLENTHEYFGDRGSTWGLKKNVTSVGRPAQVWGIKNTKKFDSDEYRFVFDGKKYIGEYCMVDSYDYVMANADYGICPAMHIDFNKFNEEPSTEKPSTDKPVVEVMKGDIDGNGKITASDARTVLRMAAKLEPTTADAVQIADMNADGKLTASDARTILRKAAKLE